MALETKEQLELEKQKQDLCNEFSIDIIPSEEELTVNKDKVR